MNVAVVAPAATLTVTGTVSAVLLEARLTGMLTGAAWFNVTVQLLTPPGLTVRGAHCKDVGCRGATNEREAICELEPDAAVITAV